MSKIIYNLIYFLVLAAICGCDGDRARILESPIGYVAITNVSVSPATGPGMVSIFNTQGELVSILRDYYSSGTEYPSGITYLGNFMLAVTIDGADRIEIINFVTGVSSSLTNSNLTAAPLRHIIVDNDNSLLVTESSTNTVEKFDASNSRVGNPFLATTTGACVLTSPWGIGINKLDNTIAVISSAVSGRFSLFNPDGTCNTHVTTAPFNSGTPTGIAYHAPSGYWIVTFATTHAIYAVNAIGGGAIQIYLNSSIINTPRAVACDSTGNIYVGSDGTDTIEKLYWSGSGLATRALAGPFAGPNVYTTNPVAITVIE